jgi:hypothetical protein
MTRRIRVYSVQLTISVNCVGTETDPTVTVTVSV